MIPVLAIIFSTCAEENETPDFTQPSIDLDVEQKTVSVNGKTVNLGPAKDYEQDSEVIYQLTVSSIKKLSKLVVETSADAFDMANSKVLSTSPENVLDAEGNFTKTVNNVVIFYQFHIHAAVPPKTRETVSFTLLDESNNAGSVSKTHTVIKKGSTSGRPLIVIEMPWNNQNLSAGMGTQENIHYEFEMGLNPDRSWIETRGPFFDLKHGVDYMFGVDAVANAENIDFVGYRVNNNTINTTEVLKTPPLSGNNVFLVSPSDSLVLYTAFIGAIPYRVAFMATVPPNSINEETGQQIANTPLYIPKLELTYAGITKVMQFYRDNNNTVSAFRAGATNPPGTWPAPPQPGFLQEYRDAGIELQTNGNRLEFRVLTPFAGYQPPEWKTLEGGMDAALQETRDYLKVNILRRTMMEVYQKLRSEGKQVKVVKFLRLDNAEGPSQLTPEAFEELTHDNELDALLAEVESKGDIRVGPLALNQVYGFVSSDGKRGFIRTSAPQCVDVTGTTLNVPAPNAGNLNIYGSIKWQDH
ncbi:hypothetical protein AGMMS50239_38650 [Bacteroidia bacterium]|nr:hypothetical protein AGMMS50239_38650 [Bacteroidia bacterium]